MDCSDSVRVPISLLLDELLKNSDRLVWMMIQLDSMDETLSAVDLYSPTRLAKRTRLARSTIYTSLDRLETAGWYTPNGDDGTPQALVNYHLDLSRWVYMSAELLTSKLKSRDIVMYGLLKDENYQRELGGQFTYRGLANYTRHCVKTVRRAIHALVQDDWLNTWQKRKSQMAPYEFTLDTPSAKYCREQIEVTKMRLSRSGGHGEAIAMAMVRLVVESSECWANTRPGWLVNPETKELMEIDICFPEHRLAVEFNGPQHYHPTSFASAEDVAKQQNRDKVKAEILREKGFHLVVLTADDLSIDAVINKLQGLVPLRNLRWYGQLVDYLNYVGECYQRKARQPVYET